MSLDLIIGVLSILLMLASFAILAYGLYEYRKRTAAALKQLDEVTHAHD